MALDPNILLQTQPVQLQSPLDAMSKAMTLKRLSQQNQMQDREFADQDAMRSAYRNNMSVGPDGTPTLDRAGFMSQLGQQNPMLAMQKGQELSAQDAAMQKQKFQTFKEQTDAQHEITMAMNADNYQDMRAKAISMGLPNAQQLPPTYPGDQAMQAMQFKTMEMKDQTAAVDREQAHKDKETDFQLRRGDQAIHRDQLASDKDTKDGMSLDKHLALGWTARSGQAGVVQGKIVAAEAAEQLIAQGKAQDGGLDSRQIEELAQSTGKLLGGGAAASARVEALVPHTFWGKTQTLKEWAANSPKGADQQAFTDRMAETVAREKALAENQKTQFQIEGLPAFAALKSRNPTYYNNILAAKGIDPSMIDEKGRYKPAAHSSGNDLHDLSDADVDKLYQQSGGK